ncbi:FAD-binding oxidoreductase [Enterococcus termitis]|uniref:FAD-binding PCMH-type domain-containing protein n=1 Tax=Enterococcus termitis TaxID=332950 RepID=A0A1E5GVQ6_9ENTE|nr:FAD-linked oxidase C-terminal domain-containing protein [Enterococcus termitis]OEG16746.1 hypothetical protein BCR25_03880 [Enterococcus termitis]OJG99447.1 hypothetical protein RV18_GL001515 [Enterococcus termitis]
MMEHRCFFKRNEIYFETENLAVFAYDAFLEKNFPELVVFPKNEKEMIMVINYLKSQRLPYLIRGGATNYVGSVVPINNDIIVSTLRMEKKWELDIETNTLVDVSSSCTVDEIKNAALPFRHFPPDPASKNVATLGGIINMNAGGAYCFKYGVTKNYIKKMNIHYQNDTLALGYDNQYSLKNYPIKDLLIGSEGTLAPVLHANLKVLAKEDFEAISIVYFSDYRAGIRFILEVTDKKIPLSAIDMSTDPFIPAMNINKVVGCNVIISIESYSKEKLNMYTKKLKSLIARFQGTEIIKDNLHKERLDIVQRNVQVIRSEYNHYTYFLFDSVIPRSKLSIMLEYLYKVSNMLLMPLMNTYHAGDGNIHPTVFYDSSSIEDREKLELFLFLILSKTVKLGGTITGEHGIGQEKKDFQSLITPSMIEEVFKKIKEKFDPDYLLNVDKLICKDYKSNKEKYINKIVGLKNKYINGGDFQWQIRRISSENHIVDHRDGLISIQPQDTLKTLLNKQGYRNYAIPYYPIINGEEYIINLIKYGIPSFYDNCYEIQNYITYIENEKVEFGSKTLKNVMGFNLIGFLLSKSTSIQDICVKCINKEYIKGQLCLYEVEGKLDYYYGTKYIVKKDGKTSQYLVGRPEQSGEKIKKIVFRPFINFSSDFYIYSFKSKISKECFDKGILIDYKTLITENRIKMTEYQNILSIRRINLREQIEKIIYINETLKKQLMLEKELEEVLHAIF